MKIQNAYLVGKKTHVVFLFKYWNIRYKRNYRIYKIFKKNTQLSMPDLWSLLMEKGKKIGIYEHDGEWFDIGKMDEYLRVNKEVEK